MINYLFVFLFLKIVSFYSFQWTNITLKTFHLTRKTFSTADEIHIQYAPIKNLLVGAVIKKKKRLSDT